MLFLLKIVVILFDLLTLLTVYLHKKFNSQSNNTTMKTLRNYSGQIILIAFPLLILTIVIIAIVTKDANLLGY